MTTLIRAVPESNRIMILDIIRGFALFGILLVNTPSLNTPVHLDTHDFGFKTTNWDHIVSDFIFAFAMESFYPIFALLFGIGAAMFLNKSALKINILYLRRMFFLFLIGLLHAIFVWWGDILMIYAVLGTSLLFFYKLEQRALFLSALVILCASWSLNMAQALIDSPAPKSLALDSLLVYTQGSFSQISIQRLHDYFQAFFNNAGPLALFAYYGDMLGIMLLGMWIEKRGIFRQLEQHTKFIAITALLSLFLSLMCWHCDKLFSIDKDSLAPIKGLSTGIFYIAAVILICKSRAGFYCLSPLANNGRMSMSNYLGFNICLSLIFYSYGLGLYGSLGPAAQMPIVAGIYILFTFLSMLWLRYYSYGPFEYIWRLATYGGLPGKAAKIL